MDNKLSRSEVLSLGFMTFAFFLGAGNLIFPPYVGLASGENMLWAMTGFLLTAVGLPLVALVAVAKAGGGIPAMTKQLPVWVGTTCAVIVFMVIGPLFAAPRTGLVAYEVGLVPFLSQGSGLTQLLFTFGFFSAALILALNPGKLLDSVGKYLTPALIILLAVVGLSVFFAPINLTAEATDTWQNDAFSGGFLEGYLTMDALASLVFGVLIVDVLRQKGVTDRHEQAKYLTSAAWIAALGLGFVYISLFFLGAASSEIATDASNGGAILTDYVSLMFGQPGIVMLSLVVMIACLTTAVGLISACADYFGDLLPKVGYRNFAILNALACAVIANVGLETLIAVSVPVLFIVYPVAMALILHVFFKPQFSQPNTVLVGMLSASLFSGVLAGLSVADLATDWVALFSGLPLFDQYMSWLPLTLIVMVIGALYKRAERFAKA